MGKSRFVDQREHRFVISEPTHADPTLIVCPKCSGIARIYPVEKQPQYAYAVRAVCSHCGFCKNKSAAVRCFYWHDENPTDGYFGYQLWLQIPCGKKSLWAFNLRHLKLLEDFVRAELRETPKDGLGYSNSSLTSRLPKWIKSAKNREKVLSCLQKLRQKAGC